jgi:integrase
MKKVTPAPSPGARAGTTAVIRGGKDRRTPLAQSAVPRLRGWLRDRGRDFRRDQKACIRCTGLTEALVRKYPNAERSWP